VSGPAGLEAVDAPAGVVIWGHDGAAVSMVVPVSFLVRPQDRFFVPTCAGAMTPRAGAVMSNMGYDAGAAAGGAAAVAGSASTAPSAASTAAPAVPAARFTSTS
jgi:hypothetical protein